jgi:hypothetical protein
MNLLLFQKKRLSKGIRLALDFMGGNLDSRISFSRGSNATVVGSNGLIQYAPHNLLTYSEQFDNVAWGKTRATITANATTAPDGTTTADKLIDDGATVGQGYISQNATYTNIPYSFSFYAKAGEVSAVRCYIVDSVGIISASNAIIDLISGTVTSGSANVVSIGNGWWRITVIGTPTAGSGSVRILLPTDTATTNGFYIWGAQLNEGALQPYYTTTVKNLLGYSQNFGNAAWTKSNSSIAASTVIGPFGFDGGEKLVENTVNAAHGVNIDVTASPTTKYTVSSYIKAGERTWARIALIDNLGIDGGRAWFDLVNGVVGNVDVQGAGSNITASIVAVGNGWYRCSVSGQMNNSKTTLTSQIRLARSNGDISYIGDGVSGIYIFGAQLSDSASLDPYSYNPVAAPTSTAYYGPRFDYDPATLAPKGLLIEEQRTNLLTYSSEFENTAWTKTNATVSANVTIAPDGTLTADKLEPATTASTSIYQSVVIAASSYTGSVYVKKGSGASDANRFYLRDSTTSTTLLQVAIDYDTLVITYVIGSTGASVQNVGNGWLRVSLTITSSLTIGNTLRYGVCFVGNNETAGEFAYAWGAQLEAGAFSTSYIPTTSATVTRAADNASMEGSNFSSWYNQSEGTIYAAVSFTNTSSFNTVYSITDGTVSNAIRTIQWNNGTDRPSNIVTAGVLQMNPVSTGLIGNAKYCVAFALNNANYAKNGVLGVDDTSVTLPTVNQLAFGSTAGATFYLNGHIQSIKYYPKRLPNADLQRLTR